MELLSYELTTRIAKRRPTHIAAMKGGGFALPAFLIASAFRLALGCARGMVSVVHLGDPVLAPLAIIARAFGVPTSVTIHGLDVTYAHPLYQGWLRLFLRHIDAYVCIGEAARGAAALRGVPAERTTVIGIGIDVDGARTPSRRPREQDMLLFVGRLVRRKGLRWFVADVLPKIVQARPHVRLAVLGDGPERARIVQAASEAGVLDRILVLGSLSDTEKWDYYARASLCIMPNISVRGDIEGFGIVSLEAMAAGCPLVVADVDGLRDAVGNASVIRLPAEDSSAWSVTLAELLADADGCERRAVDARQFVRTARGWNVVIDRYDALFTSLVERGRRA